MRGYETDRPAVLAVAIDSGNGGHPVASGRHVQAIIGPDDEEIRRHIHTPKRRREEPRALDEIFRR